MQDKVFVDTNIFVYAKIESMKDLKNEKAIKFLRNIQSEIIISTQVLSEIYNTLSRYKILDSIIKTTLLEIIQDTTLSYISLETIQKSWDMEEKYKYSSL
ncbi:MAG: PIN domain-containing protein [Leptospiraceae bacterium]|nr:PIN domain-containing protein [Leptospiraceae bacterium]